MRPWPRALRTPSLVKAKLPVDRTIHVTVFIDAAGNRNTEAETVEIVLDISGRFCPAEPDVGVFQASWEDVTAADCDGHEVELTENELDQAEQELAQAMTAGRKSDANYYRRCLDNRTADLAAVIGHAVTAE